MQLIVVYWVAASVFFMWWICALNFLLLPAPGLKSPEEMRISPFLEINRTEKEMSPGHLFYD
jgi:hypothetical protein